MESWKPTVVVGIDFGMTCTGVAYSTAPEWAEPKCIQRWPGQFQLANKVTTQVAYDDRDRLITWGFQCHRTTDVATSIMNEFKLYLDPSFPDNHPGRPSHQEAVRWYKDFMRSLWVHLDSYFDSVIPDWRQRNVQILISIPTTWTSPQLTARLKSWLEEAGLATAYNRRVDVNQTEAEAAAVYAAKQTFKVGDIIMVADAGGATTDINILEITERRRDRAKLRALDKAEGINVGSTQIDGHVKELVKAQLKQRRVQCNDDEVHWLAEDMMKSCAFEEIKCGFDGTQLQMDTHMAIPEENFPEHNRYQRQHVTITVDQLRSIFDNQLKLMFSAMDNKLHELMNQRPDPVKYLVLSGGLGSSKYVQRRIQAQYATRFPNMKVLCADEPQLAVAKGLVMDRVQALSTGSGVYTGRISRVSYGVLCREAYDKVRHRGEDITEDSLDKTKWAENMIEWLVEEGHAVEDTDFTKPYRLKIPKAEIGQGFEAQFVKSDAPAKALPRSLRHDGVERLCTLRFRFSEQDFRQSSSHQGFRLERSFLSRRRDHYIAEFNLRIIVGSTDLKFEIETMDGRKLNMAEARVEVEWEETEIRPKPKKPARTMFAAQR